MTKYLVKADLPQSTYVTYSTSQPANMMEKPIFHTIHFTVPLVPATDVWDGDTGL